MKVTANTVTTKVPKATADMADMVVWVETVADYGIAFKCALRLAQVPFPFGSKAEWMKVI
jgi:hypothetical protein